MVDIDDHKRAKQAARENEAIVKAEIASRRGNEEEL